MRRIKLCHFENGSTVFSKEASALLLGVSVEEMLERWNPADGPEALPDDLKRKGAKRAKAATDALGTNVGNVVAAWWARAQWGARIDYDPTNLVMWAVLDEPNDCQNGKEI